MVGGYAGLHGAAGGGLPGVDAADGLGPVLAHAALGGAAFFPGVHDAAGDLIAVRLDLAGQVGLAALGVDAHLGRLGVEPGRFRDPLLVHLFNEEVPAFPEGGVRCQAADEAQEEIRGGFLEFDRRGHEVEAVGAPVDGIDTFPVFLAVAEGDALGADAGGGVLALAGSSGLCGGFCLFTGSALHAHGQETSEASSEGEGHAVGGVIIFDALVITAGEEDGSPALDDGLIAVEEGIAVIGGHGDLHTDID